MNKTIEIAGKTIGEGSPPFIIAEMSGNHNQSIDRALEIVEAAAEAGADAIKIQTYTAETMTLDISEGEFFIEDENSLWKGNSLYNLYEKAHTPWDWHKAIFDKAFVTLARVVNLWYNKMGSTKKEIEENLKDLFPDE